MDSNIKRVIYVSLLGEGTDVARPTEALDLGNGKFRILPTADYDPQDEEWEFPPNSVVECVLIQDAEGEYLKAIRKCE